VKTFITDKSFTVTPSGFCLNSYFPKLLQVRGRSPNVNF